MMDAHLSGGHLFVPSHQWMTTIPTPAFLWMPSWSDGRFFQRKFCHHCSLAIWLSHQTPNVRVLAVHARRQDAIRTPYNMGRGSSQSLLEARGCAADRKAQSGFAQFNGFHFLLV